MLIRSSNILHSHNTHTHSLTSLLSLCAHRSLFSLSISLSLFLCLDISNTFLKKSRRRETLLPQQRHNAFSTAFAFMKQTRMWQLIMVLMILLTSFDATINFKSSCSKGGEQGQTHLIIITHPHTPQRSFYLSLCLRVRVCLMDDAG